jgi:hypothetical protein
LSDAHIDKNKKLAKLNQFDAIIRGAYFSTVIPIQQLVGDIISYHFCPDEDKRKQFVSLILNSNRDYTFSYSIDILERILLLHYADLLQEYPTLINELGKIRNYLNWLAHSMLDTSDEFLAKDLTDTIRLISYGNNGETNYRELTRTEIDERLEDCINVHFMLVYIRMEVRERVLNNKM